MRANEKYVHGPEPIYLNIDSEEHNIEEILGATGTQNVDGDDELPSINPNLFYFFQWH